MCTGYDDQHGELKLVRNDHLNYRFKIMDKLGRGSFGQVRQRRAGRSRFGQPGPC